MMLNNLPSAKVLQTFESAARLKSFTLAAQELFLTQSAISRQIKSLEDTLSFRVFNRDNNRVELTPEGEIFFGVVSEALNEISSSAERLRKGKSRQRLFIALPPTFSSRWLAPRLSLFRQISPVTFSITTHQNLSYSNFGKYDCQVGFGTDLLATSGGQLLFSEKLVPACSPAVQQKIESQGNLDGIPVLHTLSENRRLPYWELWLASRQETPITISQSRLADGIEFSTQDQTIVAALNDFGIAMVDINIASTIIAANRLIPLGPPVTTMYGYWAFSSKDCLNRTDPSCLFFNWLLSQGQNSQ